MTDIVIKDYTVVMDWESGWWESEAAGLRFAYGTDAPQVFHVLAPSAADASDQADELAVDRFSEDAAEYLKHVAVLLGHARLVKEGE
ncbi:hypothetical protein [Streptomyces microflavus]|uniref:hypothetical protein n=1 Tax=Streptomyces microflavus TaxID=1919 RepID=UPI0036881E9F